MMDKKRLSGLVLLYLHDGIPPCIKVITQDARRLWNNKLTLAIAPQLSYRSLQEMNPDAIINTEYESIELDTIIVEGIDVLAGFSDRLYMLVIALPKH